MLRMSGIRQYSLRSASLLPRSSYRGLLVCTSEPRCSGEEEPSVGRLLRIQRARFLLRSCLEPLRNRSVFLVCAMNRTRPIYAARLCLKLLLRLSAMSNGLYMLQQLRGHHHTNGPCPPVKSQSPQARWAADAGHAAAQHSQGVFRRQSEYRRLRCSQRPRTSEWCDVQRRGAS